MEYEMEYETEYETCMKRHETLDFHQHVLQNETGMKQVGNGYETSKTQV